MSKQTISSIVIEVCNALYASLKNDYLPIPNNRERWEFIAQQFQEMWNFPNCIGALDGKHVVIKPPIASGSYYYNYKGSDSIVLMALVDADLKFIYVDVGTNGRVSDGGVWGKTDMKEALEAGKLSVPQPTNLPNSEDVVPFVIVADEAFPLTPYLMRNYPARTLNKQRRIFNYRLSRARRVSENAFGILANQWRVYRSPIPLEPNKVRSLVLSTVVLHNYLRSKSTTRALYTPEGLCDREDTMTGTIAEGNWRIEAQDHALSRIKRVALRHSQEAKLIRDKYCSYFSSVGAVSWQNRFFD